jgi:hypothetical protein
MLESNEVKEILKEILKWTKFQGIQKAKSVLEATLDDDVKKLVYYLSDGEDSKTIASRAKVSDWTVRNYWKKWAVLGIIEPYPKYKGRYWKLFSLEEFGIGIPEIESETKTKEEKTEQEPAVKEVNNSGKEVTGEQNSKNMTT